MPNTVVVDHTNLWKLITIMASLLAVIALGIFGYQQRTPILESLVGHKLKSSIVPMPSEITRNELEAFVKNHPTVVGVNIGKANFVENYREFTYFFFKNNDVNDSWETTPANQVPLFGDDTTANARIVALINGQFVCTNTEVTVAARLHTILNKYSKTTCSVAIPPGYGDFSGWINIFLTVEPTFQQMEALRKDAEALSKSMYERDIIHRTNNVGSVNILPLKE